MDTKPSPDTCPRCGSLFICRANAIQQCDCTRVHLTPAEQTAIRDYTERTYGTYTCLCTNCLIELKEQAN